MNIAEVALIAALTDSEKIEILVEEGLDHEHIPTESLHKLVDWAINIFMQTSRTQAPSREAMLLEWGLYIADNGIELPDEDVEVDPILWAIQMLKANYISTMANNFQLELGGKMGKADPQDRLRILTEHADMLSSLSLSLVPRRVAVESREGLPESLARYRERAENPGSQGMLLGLPPIDEHLGGIRPGELAVLAAGPKTGKSIACLFVAMAELERTEPQRITTIFTLEMTVEETYDRMACVRLGLDHSKYLLGSLAQEDVDRLVEESERFRTRTEGRLHVIQPDVGERTPEAMLRMARMRDTDSLIIDQLTFMEHPSEGKKKRDEVIREKMHDLKNGLTVGRTSMSCLLAHQINREGVKLASKHGWLSMEYMADGSEVERTVDLAFGLYQSSTERSAQMMKFQMLAARRLAPKNWYLSWRLGQGRIKVLRELEEPSS